MTPGRRFAFCLALALGQLNPDAMLAQMPLRIYREWQRYYQYDPFGGIRSDIHAARIMAWMGEVHRSKNSSPHFKMKRFLIKWGPKDPVSPDAMLDKLMQITRAMGGTIIDKRES